jgi:S1-C subfamily serine protease
VKDLQGRLLAPKVATSRVLAPKGLWGFSVGEPTDGVSSRGVPVKEVLRNSPAAAAGLKAGDVLTALDGRWTTSAVDVYAAASSIAAGQSAEVVILRDGVELTLKIKPADGI